MTIKKSTLHKLTLRILGILILMTSLSCIKNNKDLSNSTPSNFNKRKISFNNNNNNNNNKSNKSNKSKALILIPSQSVDLYSIYEDYPDLKSITIEGRHGGASYSLEELTENNFVITATEPRSAGFYLVQVEVPSLEVGKFNIIQFSYTF